MNIEEVLKEINSHDQFQDKLSHHSIRDIGEWKIVLGEIFGTASKKVEGGYYVQILREDDDYWYLDTGYQFSSVWLKDFETVLTNTKKELK